MRRPARRLADWFVAEADEVRMGFVHLPRGWVLTRETDYREGMANMFMLGQDAAGGVERPTWGRKVRAGHLHLV